MAEDEVSLEQVPDAETVPMQRQLRRQIGVLEQSLAELRSAGTPAEGHADAATTQLPADLPADELEVVRDELLEDIYALQHRVAQRFAAGVYAPPPVAPPPEPTGWRARLRRRAA
jgi:hypothetical protein